MAASARPPGTDRGVDADSVGAGLRDAKLAEFRRRFEKMGERYFAPSQNLAIDVLNIDLAGDYDPWRA
jgi:hypothetical protein